MSTKQKNRKKIPFGTLVKKRLFERNKEHVGIKTSHNLFRLRPIMRLISKGKFMQDESKHFPQWIEDQKSRGSKHAIIMGNAPCLNDLPKDLFNKLKSKGVYTIGLNRSIYAFDTDVLIWADLLTIDEILKKRAINSNDTTVLHVRHVRDHSLEAKDDEGFQALHRYWSKHRNFRDWDESKLYMFRNGATAALHLCYKLGVDKITMIGFGFDDRSYFYKTDKYKKKKKYEIISEKRLEENCGGYTTHRIIQEILEYLTLEEGLTIRYNGDSKFLKTVEGLQQITNEDLEAEL